VWVLRPQICMRIQASNNIVAQAADLLHPWYRCSRRLPTTALLRSQAIQVAKIGPFLHDALPLLSFLSPD
jgi:hypothetical protein